MARKVMVTGVAGFLGSHIADRFLEQGDSVVGCDNLLGGYLDNVSDEVEFFQYDCKYLNSMKKIMRGVDTVYHCAATAYEGLSVFAPYLVTQNTFQISASVITAAISSGVRRLVYCSSMARYGRQDTVPFLETMSPQPQDPYGIAKLASEQLLRNLCEVHGMEFVVAIPHNIIGPRQKYDDPYRNVASIMINLMLQGRQPIIYGKGEQKRCFSIVYDDLQVLQKLADDKAVNGQLINIGPDEEFVTINQLAAIIAEILHFKLDPVYVPGRPQEVELATCSAAKARHLLGYKTEHSLREGLEEMVEWIQKRGPKKFKYTFDIEIENALTPKTWTNKMF
jgi:UDP-glucose 4-epimerase